jgi:hypothetical protein
MTMLDGLLPLLIELADRVGIEIPATTVAERAYLEWARDEDRVLHGHIVQNWDGSVSEINVRRISP